MRRFFPLLLAGVVCFSACLPRHRLNSACSWTGDPSLALDLRRAADRNHLIEDVEVAEELGVRYGDAFKKRDGTVEEGRRRTDCTAALLANVAAIHGLPQKDVIETRGRRPARVDAAGLAVFALLYGVASVRLVRALFGRIRVADAVAAFAAIALASVMTGAAGVLSLNMFGVAVDVIRWGDLHGSYRASRGLPWSRHWIDVFVAFAIVFWVIGLIEIARGRRRGSDRTVEPSSVVGLGRLG
jgi:hypothetical protein